MQYNNKNNPVVSRFESSAINTVLPLVTLVVTNYNYEKYLEDCLTSIRNQDYKKVECVIVDDKSTDGSVQFIKNYLVSNELSESFRLVEHSENAGQLAAFATGFNHANGSFIVFVDADDILLENFVSIHVLAHLENPAVAFTCSRAFGITENRELMGYVRLGNFKNYPVRVLSQAFYNLQWPWSCTSSMMFRKSVLSNVLKGDTNLYRYCADLFICYFANLLGGSILIPEAYTAYRLHDSNQFYCIPIIGESGNLGDMKKHPPHRELMTYIRQRLIDNHEKLQILVGMNSYIKHLARMTPLGDLWGTVTILANREILTGRYLGYLVLITVLYNARFWFLRFFRPVKLPILVDI